MPRQPGRLSWMDGRGRGGALVVGSFEVATLPHLPVPQLRSEHAQPGAGVPPDMLVVVSEDGKTFHAGPDAPCIHDKAHFGQSPAREALREGYAPCVRCMKQYLNENARPRTQTTDDALRIRQFRSAKFKLICCWFCGGMEFG